MPIAGFSRLLRDPGLELQTGPFVFRLKVPWRSLSRSLHRLYADFPIEPHVELVDFELGMQSPAILWQRWRPRAALVFNGLVSSEVYRRQSALAGLEWGMNACIWTHCHQFLILHAAVLEREGQALLLSGLPGAGKSTLCAALAHSGWRLLSDELALIRPGDGRLLGLARPICLKNESIDVIRQLFPRAEFAPLCKSTPKGVVGYLRPSVDSVLRMHEPARPAWVVFPRYEPGAVAELQARPKGTSMIELVNNSFNYSIWGEAGFERVADLVDQCGCYQLCYSNLPEAIAAIDELVPSDCLVTAGAPT